jgi:preprotein translocase subunit SecA
MKQFGKKMILLQVINSSWKDHLYGLDLLKRIIVLVAMHRLSIKKGILCVS